MASPPIAPRGTGPSARGGGAGSERDLADILLWFAAPSRGCRKLSVVSARWTSCQSCSTWRRFSMSMLSR